RWSTDGASVSVSKTRRVDFGKDSRRAGVYTPCLHPINALQDSRQSEFHIVVPDARTADS
ncbi:Hypothetical predicted protein, partial [Marmota monax]